MAKQKETSTVEVKQIKCPACESSVSSDGHTLHAKSKRFSELEEVETSLPEVTENLEKAAKEIERLREEIKKLKAEAANAVVQVDKGGDENPDEELES